MSDKVTLRAVWGQINIYVPYICAIWICARISDCTFHYQDCYHHFHRGRHIEARVHRGLSVGLSGLAGGCGTCSLIYAGFTGKTFAREDSAMLFYTWEDRASVMLG